MRKNIYNFTSNFEEYQKILETPIAEMSHEGSSRNCYIDKSSLKMYTNNFTEDICAKALNYLGKIEEKKNDQQYIEDGCKYFFYWLQVEVIKEETVDLNILNLYKEVLNKYEDIANNYELPKYLNIISEHNIQKFIDMVDMYKNFYDFIKNKVEHGKDKCDYANKCVSLYEKNIKVCKEGSDYDFCYELDKFRDEYNKHMEKNEQCENLQKILPSYRTHDPVVITSIPCVIILVTCFFFFLYKFSPLGSCLLNRINKKKRISNNIDYETQNLSHISKGTYKNNNRQYNIAYISS
ncbi:unnamed protein product [Plasmodium vivax]|uniref:(malaria parasite P. vivax) hypothetical protein n=1 Tax=Plasmodium vivax TaxID=5855 RepID=A0A8S4HCX4_PLAVI|nr:unnamed protein product [Plasmodium vivax]